jgi:hypothetical protein
MSDSRDCRICGDRLFFSARQRGDGLCGPCSRGEQPKPKWSTEWPTEPGWYWTVQPFASPEAAEVRPSGTIYCGEERVFEEDGPRVWYPIEPPDLGAARAALRGADSDSPLMDAVDDVKGG